MSHVKDFEEFAKWRDKTGDNRLAEHLRYRKHAMKYGPLIVIVTTAWQRQDVVDFINDNSLHGYLQVESL